MHAYIVAAGIVAFAVAAFLFGVFLPNLAHYRAITDWPGRLFAVEHDTWSWIKVRIEGLKAMISALALGGFAVVQPILNGATFEDIKTAAPWKGLVKDTWEPTIVGLLTMAIIWFAASGRTKAAQIEPVKPLPPGA